jgi:hypothetical protein
MNYRQKIFAKLLKKAESPRMIISSVLNKKAGKPWAEDEQYGRRGVTWEIKNVEGLGDMERDWFIDEAKGLGLGEIRDGIKTSRIFVPELNVMVQELEDWNESKKWIMLNAIMREGEYYDSYRNPKEEIKNVEGSDDPVVKTITYEHFKKESNDAEFEPVGKNVVITYVSTDHPRLATDEEDKLAKKAEVTYQWNDYVVEHLVKDIPGMSEADLAPFKERFLSPELDWRKRHNVIDLSFYAGQNLEDPKIKDKSDEEKKAHVLQKISEELS